MTEHRHLLVFRFSSLGDVAMTVPVINLLLQQHPSIEITIVSTPFVQPLFNGIARLHFYAADLKGSHKGILGLFRLYRELKAMRFGAIADLHDVLRTKILRKFFSLSLLPIAVIDKGRKEKKELIRRYHKKLRPLKSSFQRYADVFELLGLPIQLEIEGGIVKRYAITHFSWLKKDGYFLIGIAPFALHPEKMYPPEKMREVLRLINLHPKIKVFLFGAKNDATVFEQWEKIFPNAQSMAGKISFEKEIELISQLDLMISMDSANMHFASLYGVPVISIWGGTHPYLGFYGWGQSLENAIQVDLECRPSSVFGNKRCPRGDLACMNLISPVVIYEKIIQQLNF